MHGRKMRNLKRAVLVHHVRVKLVATIDSDDKEEIDKIILSLK